MWYRDLFSLVLCIYVFYFNFFLTLFLIFVVDSITINKQYENYYTFMN